MITSKSNPKVFVKNNLALLAIQGGGNYGYQLVPTSPFAKLPLETARTRHFSPLMNLETVTYPHLNTETIALNYAFGVGILQDFLDESKLIPTVGSRMGSGKFSFFVNNFAEEISVDRVQIEIDAGFESETSVSLFEAKMGISSSFNIRQLYYPFRTWQQKVHHKPIRNVFLDYEAGTYRLFEYIFPQQNIFNQLELIQSVSYRADQGLTTDRLMEAVRNASYAGVDEPVGIPFPQANSVERMLGACERIGLGGFKNKDEIFANSDIDPRQWDYYLSAARYFGLVSKSGYQWELTSLGHGIVDSNGNGSTATIVTAILARPVFLSVIEHYLDRECLPPKDQVARLIQAHTSLNLTTALRRASTVLAVANWVIKAIPPGK
jgi:hypothetical protein